MVNEFIRVCVVSQRFHKTGEVSILMHGAVLFQLRIRRDLEVTAERHSLEAPLTTLSWAVLLKLLYVLRVVRSPNTANGILQIHLDAIADCVVSQCFASSSQVAYLSM